MGELSSQGATQDNRSLALEEWLALEARLLALRSRPGMDNALWKAEIESALSVSSMFDPLVAFLKADAVDSSYGSLSAVLDAALRIMATQPQGMFRDTLSRLISQQVEDALRMTAGKPVAVVDVEQALYASSPFKLAKWLLPSIIAVVFGGTVFFGYKIDGLYTTLTTGKAEIVANVATVRGERDAALREIDNRINSEVASRKAKLDELFNSAQSTVSLKLGELGPRLDTLTKDFSLKSDGLFEDHKKRTDAAWKQDEDNWHSLLTGKQETALAYFQEKRAQADSSLNAIVTDARAVMPTLAKQLDESKAAAADLTKQVADRRSEITSLQTVAEANQGKIHALEADLARVSSDGKLPALVRFLGFRDWLAIAAIVVSGVALVVALRR